MEAKKTGGRPPKTFSKKEIERAEMLAAQGLNRIQIARGLRVDIKTLNKNIESNKDLEEAIERGKVAGLEKVTSALFNKAIDGDNVSMIFYLKNRDPENWEEVQKRELYGKDGGDIKTDNKWTIEVVSAKPTDS